MIEEDLVVCRDMLANPRYLGGPNDQRYEPLADHQAIVVGPKTTASDVLQALRAIIMLDYKRECDRFFDRQRNVERTGNDLRRILRRIDDIDATEARYESRQLDTDDPTTILTR